MGINNEATGEIRTEWVKIEYYFLPKYCREGRLQGYDKIDCWILHPELMIHDKDEHAAFGNIEYKEKNKGP